jgi:hypothetical protein
MPNLSPVGDGPRTAGTKVEKGLLPMSGERVALFSENTILLNGRIISNDC